MMTENVQVEWKINNQWPADDTDTDDFYVDIAPERTHLTLSHGKDDPHAVDLTYFEALELRAVLKSALKAWNRVGVV